MPLESFSNFAVSLGGLEYVRQQLPLRIHGCSVILRMPAVGNDENQNEENQGHLHRFPSSILA